jgi:hypothetical protein
MVLILFLVKELPENKNRTPAPPVLTPADLFDAFIFHKS